MCEKIICQTWSTLIAHVIYTSKVHKIILKPLVEYFDLRIEIKVEFEIFLVQFKGYARRI